MIPLKYCTAAPLFRDKKRLYALGSESVFGQTEMHEEHLMQHLNNFISNLGNNKIEQLYQSFRTRPPFDFNRERVIDDPPIVSDLMLGETFRHNKAMSEIYRRSMMDLEGMRKLVDPVTKYHISISRGIERELINHFTSLDSEALNRKTIKPLI